MISLATCQSVQYDLPVAKTKATKFGDLIQQRRYFRPTTGGFFTPVLCRNTPPWADCSRESASSADSLCYQFANLATHNPPTPFGDGKRVNQPNKGGHNMAAISIPVRSEQTHSPNTFHLAARDARKAARQWFAGIPTQSLAVWRDTARKQHCDGLPNPKERGSAFDTAFACEIGNLIIAGGGRHE